MPYKRHPTIDHYLNKVRKHQKPYLAKILGKDIIIYPNVMSPLYDRSAQIYWKMLPPQRGKRFLDMGCGTGIISVFTSSQKPKRIVAVDINPDAVRNTHANFGKYKIKDAKIILSDLFEKVAGLYDTIFFNAPYHGNKPKGMLERGTSDYNYGTLRRFLCDAKRFLVPRGKIYLGLSNMTDLRLFRKLVREYGYKVFKLQTKKNGDWTAYLYTMGSIPARVTGTGNY